MTAGMTYDGSQNVNSVTFAFSGHSASDPHFVIVDRRQPEKKNGVMTMAQYRVRVFKNQEDAVSGDESKELVSFIARWPDYTVITELKTDITWLGTLMLTAAFQTAVEKMLLPRDVAAV